VTDDGVGMEEATRERVFEPFFTTRELGEGSGLGLASVYGIVRNHGGFIDVHSKAGEGSTFAIYLPASDERVDSDKKLSAKTIEGEGRILLVDDEEMVTEVSDRMLQRLGFKVTIANSGKEAVDLYRKNIDGFDLVILDMIMPGMSGGETFDRLIELNPDINVLLSSGYSINDQVRMILDRGCAGFLQKPFTIVQLSRRIDEILSRADQTTPPARCPDLVRS
jgi:two-component system cell cycle sensor histidine kinase/response regulator CckA